VSYLLDSSVCVKLALTNLARNSPVRDILNDANARFFFSAATPWEVNIKIAKGKLDLGIDDVMTLLGQIAAQELVISAQDGIAAAQLPQHHSDPFDRLIIRQAQKHDLTILTTDNEFTAYDVKVVRG
jgi:PIN domain nuclease of toxin-antitoxin system